MKDFVAVSMACALIAFTVGCPAPTPRERMEQLGGIITEKGDGAVDLDLTDTAFGDQDMQYLLAICSNNAAWKEVQILNLSGTKISDTGIKRLSERNDLAPPKGLQVLILRRTEVSESAIEAFHEVIPDCTIIR